MKVKKNIKKLLYNSTLAVKLMITLIISFPSIVLAQITPNGLGTQIERSGNNIDIRGGTQAGKNLASLPPAPLESNNNTVLVNASEIPQPIAVKAPITGTELVLATDALFAAEYGMQNIEPVNNIKSIDEIQEVLDKAIEQTNSKTALLYWFVRDGNVTVAAVLPRRFKENGVYLRTVPNINAAQLQQTVEQFTFALTDPRQRNTENYKTPAQALYRWLIGTVEPVLERHRIDTLMIVPDQTLRSIAHAAFWNGSQFLIERYRLVQIPSINLVDLSFDNKSEKPLLAMGTGNFNGRQPPLPSVPLELSYIAIFQPTTIKINREFSFQNFTEAWTKNKAGTYHLATHADFSNATSFIEFWESPVTLEQMRRTMRSNRKANLLVLSACRTAVGDKQAELGFAGLAIGLGAKTALASTWYVDDLGTLALMGEFYRQMATVPLKAEALQRAQKAMLRGNVYIADQALQSNTTRLPLSAQNLNDPKNFRHPYYWAGFNMIGNPW